MRSFEALKHNITLKAPYTILPGSLGGVLTNMALAGSNVYVARLVGGPGNPGDENSRRRESVWTNVWVGEGVRHAHQPGTR